MFSVLGASVFLPFLPMAPIQVLTNNLLYDFSQTAIPTDNVDEEYIAKPRRWDIGNIFKFMLFIGPISSIFDYTTYRHDAVRVRLLDTIAPLFQTGWFVESLLTQTLIIHIIRTARSRSSRAGRARRSSPRRSSSASSESRCHSPGSAARSASRRCPGSIGRWSRPCC